MPGVSAGCWVLRSCWHGTARRRKALSPLPLTTPACLPAALLPAHPQALGLSGSLLGDFPIRVSPSKTAIVPVNNTYLPKSTEERELVARTVFVGNIDRVVEREQLREFFVNLCGEWRGGWWPVGAGAAGCNG